MDVWVESEVSGCEFPDKRLSDRFGKLLSKLGQKIGDTIPTACQDWAATKAAYRFFSNPRVDESVNTGQKVQRSWVVIQPKNRVDVTATCFLTLQSRLN